MKKWCTLPNWTIWNIWNIQCYREKWTTWIFQSCHCTQSLWFTTRCRNFHTSKVGQFVERYTVFFWGCNRQIGSLRQSFWKIIKFNSHILIKIICFRSPSSLSEMCRRSIAYCKNICTCYQNTQQNWDYIFTLQQPYIVWMFVRYYLTFSQFATTISKNLQTEYSSTILKDKEYYSAISELFL